MKKHNNLELYNSDGRPHGPSSVYGKDTWKVLLEFLEGSRTLEEVLLRMPSYQTPVSFQRLNSDFRASSFPKTRALESRASCEYISINSSSCVGTPASPSTVFEDLSGSAMIRDHQAQISCMSKCSSSNITRPIVPMPFTQLTPMPYYGVLYN